jgi:hypothetical protein
VDENRREASREEVRATGLPIRFGWDPEQTETPVCPRVSSSRPGSILTAWDAVVPNWYVIDARGVIRYTQLFGPEPLEKAVATILKEPGVGPDLAN